MGVGRHIGADGVSGLRWLIGRPSAGAYVGLAEPSLSVNGEMKVFGQNIRGHTSLAALGTFVLWLLVRFQRRQPACGPTPRPSLLIIVTTDFAATTGAMVCTSLSYS